jgi:hypothetical protein
VFEVEANLGYNLMRSSMPLPTQGPKQKIFKKAEKSLSPPKAVEKS